LINPGAGWPRQPSTGARAIVVGPSGRAVPLSEDRVTAASTVEALVDPSRDLAYGAIGGELELSFIVHRHDGKNFDIDENLFSDPDTGIDLVTDTRDAWVSGKRYFDSERAALAARLGPVTKQPVKIVELVNRIPQAVILPAEDNLASHEENFRNIREVLRILDTSRPRHGVTGPGRRGTYLKDLFPPGGNRWHNSQADHFTIMPAPWRKDLMYGQVSVGLPLESIPAFHVFVSGYVPSAKSKNRNLALSLGFAQNMAIKFIESRVGNQVDNYAVSAMDYAPTVGAVRASMEILATHSFALVETFLDRGQLVKHRLHVPLRLSFAGLIDSLDPEARAFIFGNADYIKEELKTALNNRYDRDPDLYQNISELNERRARRGHRPFDIFNDVKMQNMTLADYVDNMVLPRNDRRVHVNQMQAMTIRTNFEHIDTNSGRLPHGLVVVEWRRLSDDDLTIDEIESRFTAAADFARQAYEKKNKLSANEQTDEGRSYSHRLTEAVKSLGSRP
jgi:hypothetical protein